MATLSTIMLLKTEALTLKPIQAELDTGRTTTPVWFCSPFNHSPTHHSSEHFTQIAAQTISPFTEVLPQAKFAIGLLSYFSSSSVFQVIQASSSKLLDRFPK